MEVIFYRSPARMISLMEKTPRFTFRVDWHLSSDDSSFLYLQKRSNYLNPPEIGPQIENMKAEYLLFLNFILISACLLD